jgi:hydrogenase expression/formation protein HypC
MAIPMQVLHATSGIARCVDRRGVESNVDLALVGNVPPGAWLAVFLGAAREIIDAERARQIDLALGALEAALRGDQSAIDAAFPDLVGREPRLPTLIN